MIVELLFTDAAQHGTDYELGTVCLSVCLWSQFSVDET